MAVIKSPSGAMFPYYYKGGEIFGTHTGSYYSDEEGLLAMVRAEEEFIIQRKGCRRVWMDFYEDELTDRVLRELLATIQRLQPHLLRLALVGFSFRDRWRFNQMKKRLRLGLLIPIKFFSDPENAKTWLVGEES